MTACSMAALADELLSLDRVCSRGRSVDRLVPDGGGGSCATGWFGGFATEPVRFVRAPPGPARPGAGAQLGRTARQVPSMWGEDRHRTDRPGADDGRTLRADDDPLRRHARRDSGVLHLVRHARCSDLDRSANAATATRDHLHRHGAGWDRPRGCRSRARRTRAHLDGRTRCRNRPGDDVVDLHTQPWRYG